MGRGGAGRGGVVGSEVKGALVALGARGSARASRLESHGDSRAAALRNSLGTAARLREPWCTRTRQDRLGALGPRRQEVKTVFPYRFSTKRCDSLIEKPHFFYINYFFFGVFNLLET